MPGQAILIAGLMQRAAQAGDLASRAAGRSPSLPRSVRCCSRKLDLPWLQRLRGGSPDLVVVRCRA